ncbi:MAG: phosphate acyltransferase PlsX [Eikenella sp.]|nr:phosphate acyltransferase PlsX [Eikenella sp.]
MITLAVDAMGGDEGLQVTLPAAAAFLAEKSDVSLVLVGDETRIRAGLGSQAGHPRLSIVHADEVVGMDEAPQSALKNKKNSSMRLAVQQVKDGRAQAAVSAGNTGALMATARFVLKTLPGIDRPAIAKFMPSKGGSLTLMLDLGANVDCTAGQLVQFAVMGGELVGALYPERGRPRIGLLNVGTEDIKGSGVIKETHTLLSNSPLNFVGNVEGNAVFGGEVDVVVSDGFTGNAVLKAIEGAVKFIGGVIKEEFSRSWLNKLGALLALPTLKGFKNRLDPRKFNGAIFLGLRGIVIKSHGGADAEGFRYALLEAYHEVKAGSMVKIEQGVAAQLAQMAAGYADAAADGGRQAT